MLGEDAGRELLGAHLEREEPDDAAVLRPAPRFARREVARDRKADVGGERRLPHRRAAGEDDEV